MTEKEAKLIASQMKDLFNKVLAKVKAEEVDKDKAARIREVVEEILEPKTLPMPTRHVTTLPPGAIRTTALPVAPQQIVLNSVPQDERRDLPPIPSEELAGPETEAKADEAAAITEARAGQPKTATHHDVTFVPVGTKRIAVSSPPPQPAAVGVIEDEPDPRLSASTAPSSADRSFLDSKLIRQKRDETARNKFVPKK